jgi:hypothetical protein
MVDGWWFGGGELATGASKEMAQCKPRRENKAPHRGFDDMVVILGDNGCSCHSGVVPIRLGDKDS